MTFYKFSNATVADATEVNANFNETLKTSIDNALLNTTTIDVQGLISTPFKIVDLFTDNSGDNNTVNTTTYYDYSDTKRLVSTYYQSDYTQAASYNILEPSFETVTNWTLSGSGSYTSQQSTDGEVNGIYSVKLYQSGTTGNYATATQTVDFTNIEYISYYYNTTLAPAGTSFQVLINGSAVDTLSASVSSGIRYIDCSSYTGSLALQFKQNGHNNGESNTYVDFIREYSSTDYVDTFVQSVDTNVGTGFNYAYVRPKLYEAIPSGATITCYISLDAGLTWSAESNINEIIDCSVLTDTGHLIVKMNLNTDGTVTSKVSGWTCLLFE